ncbi:hypothetical protein OR16_15623 [Cupriavidus basilensis OR16]|uniref:Uncharacterized protein n=1 Tax=Cupriavidus basilensis OR16 TaxID=1127483 RepID=H1S5J8_9BURK|nr:hypothetical protein [Cupriavidus basilensis]EHP42224.1 hypothetical protein OR16_15623 [Cupriavidus basilensis OR16]
MYDHAAMPRESHGALTTGAMQDTTTPRTSPTRHARAARANVASGDVLMSDIGLLKLCRHCAEHWPADGEFFARDTRRQDGLEHICKACRKEQRSGR